MRKWIGLLLFSLAPILSFGQCGVIGKFREIPEYESVSHDIKRYHLNVDVNDKRFIEYLKTRCYYFIVHGHVYIVSYEPTTAYVNRSRIFKYNEVIRRNLYIYRLNSDSSWSIASDVPIKHDYYACDGQGRLYYEGYYCRMDAALFTDGKVENGYVRVDEKGCVTIQLTCTKASIYNMTTYPRLYDKLIYLAPKGDETYIVLDGGNQ